MDTNIKQNSQPKKEATVTLSHRITNSHARLLAGSNYKEAHISDRLHQQLRSSTSCGKQLEINEHNQMVKCFTCKKRFCLSCVRTQAWKRDMSLYPSVKAIVDSKVGDKKRNAGLWFVTLTVPTCEAHELGDRLDELRKGWRNMYTQMKKERSKAYVNGLRKLEINPNPKKGIKPKGHTDYMYHAHFHVLIQGKGNAYELKRRWLKLFPLARKWSQDVRPFDYEKGTLIELLKYLSKPTVESDKKQGIKKESSFKSNSRRKAMAFIYDKLIGRRTIFSYGTVKRSDKFKPIINDDGQIVFKRGDAFERVFDDSTKQQQERILNYLDGHKSKASKPLAQTIWNFINGHYVNDLTGDKLCDESDVKAAAIAGGEKKLRYYELERVARERANQTNIETGVSERQSIDAAISGLEALTKANQAKEKTYVAMKKNPHT